MFTQEEYLWGWVYYLGGVTLLLISGWWATQKIKWSEPRYILRLVAVIFLLFPWYTDNQGHYLSPAWIVATIEGVFEGGSAFWRAGLPLLLALFSVLSLSFITLSLWKRRSIRHQQTESHPA